MAEKDKLINEYRKRNAGYELVPRVGGWEKLEKELPPVRGSRVVFYRWVAAVAVVLLLVSVILPLYKDKQGEHAGRVEPEVVPARTESNTIIAEPPVIVQAESRPASLYIVEADQPELSQPSSLPSVLLPSRLEPLGSPVVHDLKPLSPTLKPKVAFPPSYPSWQVVSAKRKKHAVKDWSLAVYGGNVMNDYSSSSGGLGMLNAVSSSVNLSGGVVNINNAPGTGSVEDFKNDLLSNASNFRTKSEYDAFEEVALRNYNVPTQTKIRHRLPVSAGLSVQKRLSGRWTIETGLVYTFLSSDLFAGEDSHYKQVQHLHYLGIPLKMNYLFWRGGRFSLYASTGGMAEMCMDGSLSSSYYVDNVETHQSKTDLDVKRIQLSVSGTLGAQMEIVRPVSLYIEPGVSYYFDDKSEVETIRKEHPFNASFRVGIRFSFN